MRKKRILVSIFVSIFMLAINFSICWAEEKHQGETNYPWLVQGLKQFNYPEYKGYFLATIKGWSRYFCKDVPNLADEPNHSSDCEVIELNLVTKKGDLLDIKVVLNKIDMAFFLNELSPEFGKYKFWNPVIEIYEKRKRLDEPFYLYEGRLNLVGRFWTKWDKNETNKVIGYINEIYRY